jgi:cold shock CspA family protein
MGANYFYCVTRKRVVDGPTPSLHPRELRGTPATGRIARILVGQGHGFIRLRNGREVYFHRADLQKGTEFHEFRLREEVTFDLVEDAVSGARALRVVPAIQRTVDGRPRHQRAQTTPRTNASPGPTGGSE